jgi:hypothetical protein
LGYTGYPLYFIFVCVSGIVLGQAMSLIILPSESTQTLPLWLIVPRLLLSSTLVASLFYGSGWLLAQLFDVEGPMRRAPSRAPRLARPALTLGRARIPVALGRKPASRVGDPIRDCFERIDHCAEPTFGAANGGGLTAGERVLIAKIGIEQCLPALVGGCVKPRPCKRVATVEKEQGT